jgi:Family of unknown function (DUF5995)
VPTEGAGAVRDVADRLRLHLDALAPTDHRRHFLGTYLRTTLAVGQALAAGRFADPSWVGRLDAVFARHYLDAVEAASTGGPADGVPEPWRRAFAAPPGLPPLQHVLLGVNAHINLDLPQALLAVIDDADFADPALLARRHRDHAVIDAVLAERVGPEGELGGPGRWRRLTGPLDRAATRRFLRESRRQVWHNVGVLHEARLAGPDALHGRVAELERLAGARIADLLRPGPVLLRLAVRGFGVRLRRPSGSRAGARRGRRCR